jgi:hypothetical protein
MTSMLGRDRAGPASSSARAGPLPIPEWISSTIIGTSVSMANYMNAPITEANRLAESKLPPAAS